MFRFGENWREYVLNALDDKKMDEAEEALGDLLSMESLKRQTFLDIGCGSGIHAVAAARMGADRIVAVDIDPASVETARKVVGTYLPDAEHVHIRQADILNDDDVKALPVSDVVYSWGVLHHTGDMYKAIENAASRVAPEGTLVIAIYNRHITSPIWSVIKATYNRAPAWGQRMLYYLFYGVIYVAKFAATGRDPLRKDRGMDFGYDVVDWIGGYPYEYASIREITRFVEGLGFFVADVFPAEVGTGCNEFVFVKES